MKDFSSFSVRQLKARLDWLTKAAKVRDGKPREDLLAEKQLIADELAKREA